MIKSPIWFRAYKKYDNFKINKYESAKALPELVNMLRGEWRSNPAIYVLEAEFTDHFCLLIPPELYAEPRECSRREAQNYVNNRIKSVKNAITKAEGIFLQNTGIERCSFADPVEEQIADYIATTPWRWKSNDEISKICLSRTIAKSLCNCNKSGKDHPMMKLSGFTNSRIRKLCDGKILIM